MSGPEVFSLAGKSALDGIIFVFSFAGFALLPAGLGRSVWWVLLWFFLLNALFLLRLWGLPVWENGPVFMALTLGPALLFLSLLWRRVHTIPLREFLLWSLFRLMGVHFVLAIVGGYAPQRFALATGFSEILTGLFALALLALHQPDKPWFRISALFWNAYGTFSVGGALYQIYFANPHGRPNLYTPEIYHYVSSFPQSWVQFFWFPLSFAMHLALFYRLLSRPRPAAPETGGEALARMAPSRADGGTGGKTP